MKMAAVSDLFKKRIEDFSILKDKINEEVILAGWIDSIRIHGKIAFIDLRNRTGKVQLIFKESFIEKIKNLNRESVILAKGIVRERKKKKEGFLGDIEVDVEELYILNVAKPLPYDFRGFVNASEKVRLKYRYLDLRNPENFKKIVFRSKIIQLFREYLIREGFIEVETPYLTKSVPEGSRDFLVPSRLYPGKFYALAQSPQIYKQLLMIAGFEKYFQIARCFRDEDPRKDRQPEFTQVDIEMSFVDEEDVRRFVEKLVKYVVENSIEFKIKIPFKEISFFEVMEKYGSDKPDLRIPYKIDKIEDKERVKRILSVDEEIKEKNKVIKYINKVARDYNVKFYYYIEGKSNIKYKAEEIKKDFNTRNFIIVEGVDWENSLNALGKVRDFIGEIQGYKNKRELDFFWVVDFPYFELDENNNLLPRHHPFTMPKEEDLEFLEKEPLKVRAKSYDLVLNGFEVAGGSIRIHRRDLQEKIFKIIGMKKEEYLERYGYFLEALEYGAPPHGGIAFGLDRFVATLLFEENIREVIAFPKASDWKDYLTNAPSIPPKEYIEDTIKPSCEKILKINKD